MSKVILAHQYRSRFFIPNLTVTESGFSLLEYLAVITMTAALSIMVSANFRQLIDRYRVTTVASEFRIDLFTARAEAIRRQVRVDMIPVDSEHWERGWLLLIDANNNQRFDAGDLLLHRSGVLPKVLLVDAQLRDSHKSYLAFDSSGRPRSASSSQIPQIGSLMFSVGSQRRKIIISFLGRVRLCDPDKDATTC